MTFTFNSSLVEIFREVLIPVIYKTIGFGYFQHIRMMGPQPAWPGGPCFVDEWRADDDEPMKKPMTGARTIICENLWAEPEMELPFLVRLYSDCSARAFSHDNAIES